MKKFPGFEKLKRRLGDQTGLNRTIKLADNKSEH